MKSKKIVALIVAFAAFMAVATSGLAATVTTTTYSDDKVVVTAVVDAEAGKEVTYLVKNNANPVGIVYIDQQTANELGKATFSYKIATEKIPGLVTNVALGTDGDVAVDSAANTGKTLQFDDVTVEGENITVIGYYSDEACNNAVTNMLGNNPEQYIYVKVAPATGYNIATVNGEPVAESTEAIVKCSMGDTVVIGTEKIVTESTVTDWGTVVKPENMTEEQAKEVGIPQATVEKDTERNISAVTKFFKVSGTVAQDSIGVEYDGVKYPALGVTPEIKYYAVRIIVDGVTVDENLFKVYGN